ncbi:MAG: 4-(cytidine 5'-diphospho)-2-C-methyl-D-erythritol kinase [Acidobacteriota bacterium]
MTRTARLTAYAKLNLGLRVLCQRPDGYHELRTVFQTISLADRIGVSFRSARQTQVRIEGTPHIQDNLVERAAHLVLDELQLRAEVHFHLQKLIPAGAGLGGGSTDAAAVLLALPVLAGKPVPEQRLFELAAQLGSDVPFFLHGGTALGIGRGEELYPLPDAPRKRVLLIAPRVHSSTAEAYRDLSSRLTPIGLQNKLVSFQRQIWAGPGEGIVNDFEEVVFARHPELRQIGIRLRAAGAGPVAMTGSGSAIFGIFNNSGQLIQAQKSFETEQTFAVSFVSRAQYRAAWRRVLATHMQPPPSQSGPLKGNLWPPPSRYAQ